jgi:hypothetical protein
LTRRRRVSAFRHARYLVSMLDTSNDEPCPFSLRLPEDLSKALREQAQAHERSQGAEVRFILRTHLAPDRTEGQEREV